MNAERPVSQNDAFSRISWWGYYVHEARRNFMDLDLFCNRGVLRGRGVDSVGPFLLEGGFVRSSGKVFWAKNYLERHSVQYVGLLGPEPQVSGYWALDSFFGEFHIWPKSDTNPVAGFNYPKNFALYWLQLARYYRTVSDPEACESACNRGIELADGQDAEELNNLAWGLYELDRDLLTSERLARASLALAPQDTFAAHTLASIFVRQRKWNEVWPVLKVWLAQVPDWRVAERWRSNYLPLFEEIVRAGQGPFAAAVLQTVERDYLWQPLRDVLGNEDGRQLEALKRLFPFS